MYTVRIETGFQAEHRITLPGGSKEKLHLHDWIVRASVAGEKLDRTGLLFDFNRLKALLAQILEPLRNKRLEQLAYFQKNNSTAENVAKYIYQNLKSRLPGNVKISAVEVFEQPGCSATYSE